jgi:H+-transporting ATPase
MVSAILGLVGVVQSSALLRYLHHSMTLELEPLQTAMFMQLVIAGHLLLFSTRAGRFFFEPPFPEWKLFWAIMGTQLVAALMAANGWLLTPISWSLIGFIWIYNLVWLVVIDAIKVALYHHYDAREFGQSTLGTPLDPFGGRLGKLSKAR